MEGGRPSARSTLQQDDPHFRDNVLFYEFFHGDTGKGLGASHQTGWTGLVALLLHGREEDDPTQMDMPTGEEIFSDIMHRLDALALPRSPGIIAPIPPSPTVAPPMLPTMTPLPAKSHR